VPTKIDKGNDMNDLDKLIQTLKETNVPYEVYYHNKKYSDITILATSSDKYVTITFEDGKFSYSN